MKTLTLMIVAGVLGGSIIGGALASTPMSTEPGDVNAAPCPRIDIVAVTSKLSAVRVNGYTIGHGRGLQLRGADGQFSGFVRAESRYPTIVLDPEDITSKCPRNGPLPMEITKAGKQLMINNVVVGTFNSFTLTQDNQNFVKHFKSIAVPRGGHLGIAKKNGSIYFSETKFYPPGSIGGGTGGEIPGGPSLPEPKKICPVGKHCAE